ncbi:Acg family FMN-binding oxidoreductase [Marinactinospora rubrisoli]|uniref:Acg family FMN-binding oxidoreductase n=1 Tax=Marinactinospora rubrisoli TaxID=2715399 RepID=A0ABW2KM88_9ACTN
MKDTPARHGGTTGPDLSAPGTERELLRTARWAAEHAPSVWNTRPWTLETDRGRVCLRIDLRRRLPVADPALRESVISCGAALFTIRITLLAGGWRPDVHRLPDPDRPGLLADVSVAGAAEAGDLERALFAAVAQRRTHRGPFDAQVDDAGLVQSLGAAARTEGARLRVVTEPALVRSLAGLVGAAEHLHRHERVRGEEIARWTRESGGRTAPGVPAQDYPPADDEAARLFPGRDFGHGRIPGRMRVSGTSDGTVAVLATPGDARADWLTAGEALQRVLLTAAHGGVSAAFHPQPLEEPLLRRFIAERMSLAEGGHAQMLMRLGRAAPAAPAQAA